MASKKLELAVNNENNSKAIEKRKVTPTERTSEGLRDTLFDELDAVRSGDSTPQQSNAVAKLSAQIIKAAELDLKYQSKMQGKDASAPRPVLLGRQK